MASVFIQLGWLNYAHTQKKSISIQNGNKGVMACLICLEKKELE